MNFSALFSSKQAMAVAIWIFTAGWLATASSSLPTGASWPLALLIATACSAGLLLGIEGRLAQPSSRPANRLVPFVASVSVAFLSAIIVGSNSSPAELALLLAVAILPVAALGIAAVWKRPLQSQRVRCLVPCESTVTHTQKCVSSPVEDDADLLDQSTSVLDDEVEDESESILEFDPIDFDSPSAAAMTQWQTRSRCETGETIEGGIRIEFAEGQREVTVHISFCPPFARCPELMTEDLDGADLEIRVAASYPFGARLTARRPLRTNQRTQRAASESFRIGYVAISESIQRAA